MRVDEFEAAMAPGIGRYKRFRCGLMVVENGKDTEVKQT